MCVSTGAVTLDSACRCVRGRGRPRRASLACLYAARFSWWESGYLNLHAWRRDEWYPALDAAGLPHLVPYAMRHTFASFAIAAGVSLFYLARLMGSSVEQIDRTYGHMLADSEDYLRGLLNSFDVRGSQERPKAEEQ